MSNQSRFFKTIKDKLPAGLRLADVVGEVLGLGSDASYRRVRGETELSFSEITKLCAHFSVSFDAALNLQSDIVPFKYTPLDLTDGFENFYTYKNNLAAIFERIAAAKEKDMLLTALDVSVYYLTPFKALSFFKDYTWFGSMSDKPASYEQFAATLDTERLAGYFDRITDAYLQIPSTEIWTTDTLNPILYLLEYFAALNCFEDKQTVSLLCRQLLALIDDVERNAELGWKEYKGNKVPCRLYISPLSITNDFFVANFDGVKTGTIKLHTINGLFTNNEYFCSEIESWLVDMQSKSLSLTGGSARERVQFFKGLRDKVKALQARIT